MKDAVFLSLVGTQTMAVIQPLEACLQAGLPVSSVILRATAETLQHAEDIRAHCERAGHPPVTVSETDPGRTDWEGVILDAAERGGTILCNLKGGLNFAVARLVMALAVLDDVRLVDAGREDVAVADPRSGEISLLPLPTDMAIRDMLALQGIHPEPAVHPSDIVALCGRNGVPVPRNRLENIRIGGVDFALVWNGGNRPHFLADLLSVPAMAPKDWLARIRSVGAWAATRAESGELYDRECFVLCPDDRTADHVREESRGKADARFCFRDNPKMKAGILREIFVPPSPMPTARDSRRAESDTLILALGNDPAATLNAIAGHGLPNVILCHTPDAAMADLAARIRAAAADGSLGMPLRSLKTLRTDIRGARLPARLGLAEGAANVHVNITPGAKGQGAFLALWAARNGCGVWSMRDDRLCRLDGDAEDPFQACDPLALLRLRHPDLTVGGVPGLEPLYDALLAHMRACLEADVEWDAEKGCAAGGFRLERAGGKKRRLIAPSGEEHAFTLEGGEWLEGLVAHALRGIGAGFVHERVRIPWSGDLQQELEMKYQEAQHRTDMDVVAAWRAVHIMISCKANLSADVKATALEARRVAAGVSRFTLPLVCHLGCRERRFVPDAGRSGVLVFGWRELCRPDALRAVIEDACHGVRTTARKPG